MTRTTEAAILSSASLSASAMYRMTIDVVALLKNGAQDFEEKTLLHCKSLLQVTKTSANDTMRSRTIQCLLQDMVEESALLEVYHVKVKEVRSQLNAREIEINELKSLVGNSDVNHYVPDIAIKVAALLENPNKDCTVLGSIIKDLVKNQERKAGKRWNDDTKSLFAIILDYGGPALAKIVAEKLGGHNLDTMYRTARCNYVIPNKLEEQTFERAASFYTTIGYTGVFLLAMDATAVIPMLKVKGNLLIGLATEEQVVQTTAQDIINIVKEDKEKAKQATAFLLSPLQEHVPPFILAISPLYKGQDHMNVRQWFNQAVLWAGRNGITVVE